MAAIRLQYKLVHRFMRNHGKGPCFQLLFVPDVMVLPIPKGKNPRPQNSPDPSTRRAPPHRGRSSLGRPGGACAGTFRGPGPRGCLGATLVARRLVLGGAGVGCGVGSGPCCKGCTPCLGNCRLGDGPGMPSPRPPVSAKCGRPASRTRASCPVCKHPWKSCSVACPGRDREGADARGEAAERGILQPG